MAWRIGSEGVKLRGQAGKVVWGERKVGELSGVTPGMRVRGGGSAGLGGAPLGAGWAIQGL